jgi:hypothetical protein
VETEEARAALRKALEEDDALAARFAAASNDVELRDLVAEIGIEWDADFETLTEVDTAASEDISDAELATVSGGYTFPATDWIYCDNPWTNVWCTLKC